MVASPIYPAWFRVLTETLSEEQTKVLWGTYKSYKGPKPIELNTEVEKVTEVATIRTFETGANRNSDEGKYDYEGFLSPLVLERFARYMHKHRRLADGTLRASDNWQKGLPFDVCLKSLLRHTITAWKDHRGFETDEEIQESICAVIFNAQAMLLTILQREE
jgi:hypothetical protein